MIAYKVDPIWIELENLRSRHLHQLGVMWEFNLIDNEMSFVSFCRNGNPHHNYFYGSPDRYPVGKPGNGAIALQEVCDLADNYGLTITLDTAFPRLYSYYEAFGFEQQHQHRNMRFYSRRPTPEVTQWPILKPSELSPSTSM